MLLNDIGRTPTATLRKINQHLQSNYGFKISENINDKDVSLIIETMQTEITDLKLKGDDARTSSEISKRLLILEGLQTLKEFAILQLQSPKLEPLIKTLADTVVKEFHKCGMSNDELDETVNDAMKIYNSSEFRFPADYIERRVREAVLKELQPVSDGNVMENFAPLTQQEYQLKRKKLQDIQMHPAAAKNPELKRKLAKAVAALKARAAQHGLVHEKHSPDKLNKPGTIMRENNNLVKHLRTLLETEVSQAEVMMAAKGFAEELQEMVEKIGRLQNEDLPPVTDQMRETYGMESASAFQTQIYSAFQGVMDSLYTAKDQVDAAVSNMASTGQVPMSVDMDKDVDMDGRLPSNTDVGSDLDNLEDELPQTGTDGGEGEPVVGMDDEFGGAETEEPLGRAMKTESLIKKIHEMKRIVAKARKLKESHR